MHALLALVAFWLDAPATTPLDTIERRATSEVEAVEVLVWMSHESDFGRALAGHRWDGRAYGWLQIRDRPDLERDPVGSVGTWLSIKHAAGAQCHDDGLSALSSGRCDRGTRLAAARRQEAEWLDAAAAYVLAVRPWGW
jgi:hypothetical protein